MFKTFPVPSPSPPPHCHSLVAMFSLRLISSCPLPKTLPFPSLFTVLLSFLIPFPFLFPHPPILPPYSVCPLYKSKHKSVLSDTYIVATQYLKHQKFTPLACKDKGFRSFEFVAKTQCLKSTGILLSLGNRHHAFILLSKHSVLEN